MITLVVAWAVTTLAVPATLPLLRRFTMDLPNERSSHQRPVPRAGGVAVILGILAGLLAADASHAIAQVWGVVAAVLALGLLGLADDLRSLGGGLRLAVQILAGAALVHAALGTRLTVPDLALGALGLVIVVGYVNAFNFMDGINAISALAAGVAGGWFGWVGHRQGIASLVVLGGATVGAAVGFLPWNGWRPVLFLGDVGSYALGGLVVAMGLLAWGAGLGVLTAAAPMALYVVDTGWVLLKRWYGGRPLLQAHREHVYQRLVDTAGWPHLWVACGVAALVAIACLGVLLLGRGSVLAALVVAGSVAVYQASPWLVGRWVGHASGAGAR